MAAVIVGALLGAVAGCKVLGLEKPVDPSGKKDPDGKPAPADGKSPDGKTRPGDPVAPPVKAGPDDGPVPPRPTPAPPDAKPAPAPALTALPVLTEHITRPAAERRTGIHRDARVGDRLVYLLPAAPSGSRHTREVVEAGDTVVIEVRTETRGSAVMVARLRFEYVGKDAPMPARPEDPRQDPPPPLKLVVTDGTFDVGGESLACKVREVFDEARPLGRTWVSDAVPLGGLVKRELPDPVSGTPMPVEVLAEFSRGR